MSRARSPNYPALSLPVAIGKARDVYEKQVLRGEPKDIVVSHMGYNSINGRSGKSLSALLKYGLLDEVEGDFSVTERAMKIFFPDDDRERDDATLAAANSPKLFRELFERYKDAKPTPESLNGYLARNGFLPKAAEAVAKTFGETYDLVSGIESDTESLDADDEEIELSDAPRDVVIKEAAAVDTKQSVKPDQAPNEIQMNCTKPIFDFESVQIVTKIDNQDDLAELVARLEAIKGMLPQRPVKVEPDQLSGNSRSEP